IVDTAPITGTSSIATKSKQLSVTHPRTGTANRITIAGSSTWAAASILQRNSGFMVRIGAPRESSTNDWIAATLRFERSSRRGQGQVFGTQETFGRTASTEHSYAPALPFNV